MSGIVDKIKDKLHMGGSHEPNTEPRVLGANDGRSGTTTQTKSEHRQVKSGDDCPECHDKYHQEGKHIIWGDAQGKTGEAAEAARLAEVSACRAETQLNKVAETQAEADKAQSRLAELENELASLRSSGVDLKDKNREIEAARERAQEAARRHQEAVKAAEEAERSAQLREREAAEWRQKYEGMKGKMGPLEEELGRLSRARQDAEGRRERHMEKLRQWESNRQSREAELEQLRNERDGHANAVRDAEAALAAARERHHHAHTRLHHLTKEHEKGVREFEGMKGQSPAEQELERIKAREAEVMQELERIRPALNENAANARKAAEMADAERARAGDVRSQINPLSQEAQQHRAAMTDAQREAADLQERERARRQREQALAGELGHHQRRTEGLMTEKDALADKYNQHKEKAVEQNQRKEQLWDEAMHLGGVGDRNADSKLRKLENKLEGVDISGTKNKGDGTHTVTRTQHTVTEE